MFYSYLKTPKKINCQIAQGMLRNITIFFKKSREKELFKKYKTYLYDKMSLQIYFGAAI